MKILFYLPVVTPLWFKAIIVPMLRTLQGGTAPVELHVMVAPLWRNTGLEAEHLLDAADLTEVQWHVIDEGEPDQFRLAGGDVPGLLDLVAAIAPDVTLARSADFAISRQFPGVVRYIMEGSARPILNSSYQVVIDELPFAPAELPAHAAALADECAERLAPSWDLVERHAPAGTRNALRSQLGLPIDRPVVAVPLQYAHEENYFVHHAVFPTGVALIEHMRAVLGDGVVLAVTDHPLNIHIADRQRAMAGCFARHAGSVIDCAGSRASQTLALCADAMAIDVSKSWMLAAFHGTPLVNVARQPMAGWLNAVPTISELSAALAAGELAVPDQAAARRWFAWLVGARFVAPGDLTLDRLLRCVDQRPSEADIAANLALIEANQQAQLDRRDLAA